MHKYEVSKFIANSEAQSYRSAAESALGTAVVSEGLDIKPLFTYFTDLAGH